MRSKKVKRSTIFGSVDVPPLGDANAWEKATGGGKLGIILDEKAGPTGGS